MILNKYKFIEALEMVSAGTTAREENLQSSSVIFKEGWLVSYNDEIACLAPFSHEFDGAVPAAPLLRILKRINKAEVEVVQKKGGLILKAGKQSAKLKLEKKITLPLDVFEDLTKNAHIFNPISKNILPAMRLAHSCASNDASLQQVTCVHFHPKMVEATDNYMAGRYKTKTGFKKSVMIGLKM